jgi:UDP-glucose 4-epimerase
MKVLVTGGAGFIGSHIVDALLAAGHEPAVLDSLSTGRRENLTAGVPLHVADVCDRERVATILNEFRPDAVCHQAAQMSVSRSVREPSFDAQVNILGLVQTLESAANAGVRRVVFASSGGVLYGDVFEPAGEDHPADPQSPYGISKWTGEQYLKFFVRELGLEAVALRYANVYGPRQNPHGEAGVVAIFCQKLLRGEAPTINGDGRYIRDYVYVTDVARANLLALERPLPNKFRAWNVGTAQPTDVNQLAELLHRECSAVRAARGQAPPPTPVHGPARPGDLRSNLVSFQKAERELGWAPRTKLPEGLRQTAEWFATQ